MTTWQDQQPKSRRALRERERAHLQAAMPDATHQESTGTGFDQQVWTHQPVSSSPDYSNGAVPGPHQSEEPLRRPRQSGSRRTEAEAPATEAPAYRLRDFSPETRGNSFTSTQSAPWTPPSPGSEDLNYHTSTRASSTPIPAPPIVVTPEEVQAPPRVAAPLVPDVPLEHTLSRRELRELRQAAELQEAGPAASGPTIPGPVAPAPVAPAPVVQAPVAPQAVPPPYVAPPPYIAPTAAPVPPPAYPAPVHPVAPSVPNVAAAEPLREVVTAPEVFTAPVGHWSTQSEIDEGVELVGRPHQRDISSIDAITTSALVLPSFPVSMPTTGPVSGTGEILMTGSINLPRSLGVTGLHPSRYDRADIDAISDAGDRDAPAPDSAPVRAVRAVSTYTSTQGIINAKRPKGNNLPMVLSITAGVMMVGVVVLVVVGMIFKIF